MIYQENIFSEDIIHDIVDTIYENVEINNDIKNIFENSYVEFIQFIYLNVLNENRYDINNNINKYSKLYINLLYEVIYTKASQEEELLNDYINDEDGSFYEIYKNYTPSNNQNIVSELNILYSELETITFTKNNLELLKSYVSRFANLYNSLLN